MDDLEARVLALEKEVRGLKREIIPKVLTLSFMASSWSYRGAYSMKDFERKRDELQEALGEGVA